MIIPLVGWLNPASGKEGLLPECCPGNPYAKQTGLKLSKKTSANIGLYNFKTEQISALFWLKMTSMIFYDHQSGSVITPVSEGFVQPVPLSWDARPDRSRKFLFRSLLLLCCPASTVTPRLNISVLFFVYAKWKGNREHSRWSPFKGENTICCI